MTTTTKKPVVDPLETLTKVPQEALGLVDQQVGDKPADSDGGDYDSEKARLDAQAKRQLEALETELSEIRQKKEQEKLQKQQEEEQKKAQEAAAKEEENQGIIEPVAKRGRQFGANVAKKMRDIASSAEKRASGAPSQ